MNDFRVIFSARVFRRLVVALRRRCSRDNSLARMHVGEWRDDYVWRLDRIDVAFRCGRLIALERLRYSSRRQCPEWSMHELDQPGGVRQGSKKLGIEVPTPGSVEKQGSSGLHWYI